MTLKEVYEWFLFYGKITTLLNFLPVIICIIKWKYFKNVPFIWLFLYTLIYALLNVFSSWFIGFATAHYDVLGPYLQKLNIYNTFFLEPLYYLMDISLLTFFVRDTIQNDKIKKNLTRIAWVLAIFIFINTFWGEGYTGYQTIGSSVKNLYLLGISILLLRRLYSVNFQKKTYKIPHFWIAMSILTSVLGAGLIDFISNRMYNDTEIMFYKAHIVVNIFYDISSILIATGCWLFPWNGKIR